MNFFLQIGSWVLTYPLILFNRYCARQDEYAADDYACHIGLGPELYEGLAKIDDMYHNPPAELLWPHAVRSSGDG